MAERGAIKLRRIQNRKLTHEELQKQRQQQQQQQLQPQHGPKTFKHTKLLQKLHELGVECHGPYRIDCHRAREHQQHQQHQRHS